MSELRHHDVVSLWVRGEEGDAVVDDSFGDLGQRFSARELLLESL